MLFSNSHKTFALTQISFKILLIESLLSIPVHVNYMLEKDNLYKSPTVGGGNGVGIVLI